MDSHILRLLVPQIPSLSYTALQHSLGLSHTSSKWDLRTVLTVNVLRGLMNPPEGRKKPPIARVQKRTLTSVPIKGKLWVAEATIPKSAEGTVTDVVCKAVDAMGSGQYTRPQEQDVQIEWTGYRPDASKDEPMPAGLSEGEKYNRLMTEPCRTSDITWLYFHGGAYYLCDPSTHRPLTSTLAKESGGRVCSVRYRLAPQTAFPGQLIDAFLVYLSLLYPPEGSMHDAIPAEKIVLGGDSAGGNLSFALLQLILQLHRQSDGVPVVKFHGRDVHVPLPAGASAGSGWFDIARAMPSISSNASFDYLPPPNHDDTVSLIEHDSVWPTHPPRGDLYCDLSLLDHPLVSPILAADWSGSCPLWMCTGQEMITDEDFVVAKRAANQGVSVQLEQYDAMPHCFQLVLPTLANAQRCVRSWGQWARKVVEERETVSSMGVWIPAKAGEERQFDVKSIEAVPFEEVERLVQEVKERRLKGFGTEGETAVQPAL